MLGEYSTTELHPTLFVCFCTRFHVQTVLKHLILLHLPHKFWITGVHGRTWSDVMITGVHHHTWFDMVIPGARHCTWSDVMIAGVPHCTWSDVVITGAHNYIWFDVALGD